MPRLQGPDLAAAAHGKVSPVLQRERAASSLFVFFFLLVFLGGNFSKRVEKRKRTQKGASDVVVFSLLLKYVCVDDMMPRRRG